MNYHSLRTYNLICLETYECIDSFLSKISYYPVVICADKAYFYCFTTLNLFPHFSYRNIVRKKKKKKLETKVEIFNCICFFLFFHKKITPCFLASLTSHSDMLVYFVKIVFQTSRLQNASHKTNEFCSNCCFAF